MGHFGAPTTDRGSFLPTMVAAVHAWMDAGRGVRGGGGSVVGHTGRDAWQSKRGCTWGEGGASTELHKHTLTSRKQIGAKGAFKEWGRSGSHTQTHTYHVHVHTHTYPHICVCARTHKHPHAQTYIYILLTPTSHLVEWMSLTPPHTQREIEAIGLFKEEDGCEPRVTLTRTPHTWEFCRPSF